MLMAVLVLSSTLVAETSTRVLDVTAGAVNKPRLVMAPAVALQVTPDLLVLLTVAVNCCFEPEANTEVVGEILSCVWADRTGTPLVETPPHPAEITMARTNGTIIKPVA